MAHRKHGLTKAQAAILAEAARRRPEQHLFPEGAQLVNARRLADAGLLVSVPHPCAETPAFRITELGRQRLTEYHDAENGADGVLVSLTEIEVLDLMHACEVAKDFANAVAPVGGELTWESLYRKLREVAEQRGWVIPSKSPEF